LLPKAGEHAPQVSPALDRDFGRSSSAPAWGGGRPRPAVSSLQSGGSLALGEPGFGQGLPAQWARLRSLVQILQILDPASTHSAAAGRAAGPPPGEPTSQSRRPGRSRSRGVTVRLAPRFWHHTATGEWGRRSQAAARFSPAPLGLAPAVRAPGADADHKLAGASVAGQEVLANRGIGPVRRHHPPLLARRVRCAGSSSIGESCRRRQLLSTVSSRQFQTAAGCPGREAGPPSAP